ncbi:rho guanine nucleotide exchange factor 12-like isoform X1 [Takifugu rubripes]|uniref:rho guanine nucleotide exchange factor 12-like isoform X1 n=1 Tax=Takifugu rubripes TaxID=31033 RepID=UPI0011455ECB|nr:rho guanine nucleotide exchange factor 12-like isoform X1 [Takifugu rubripes]
MSQSTLTDRTPNILNKDPTDNKPKHEKPSSPLKHEFDPTGLVQRCVIIQRDKNGFGLTVSGDNPVFVQLVKENGAAMRAGVQTGDRIIKVNGTLVTCSNHMEVVKLIKSGSYVALTVLGRPPGLPLQDEEEPEDTDVMEEGELSSSLPTSPALSARQQSSLEGTGLQHDGINYESPEGSEDKTSHCQNVDVIQKMLNQEHHELQDGAMRSRSSETEDGAVGAQTSTSGADSCNDGTPTTNACSMHGSLLPESLDKGETPCQSGDITLRPSADGEDAPETETGAQFLIPPHPLNPQIIGAEDDYFDSQQEQINGECSSFQSVDLLKSRPAHLAVFLHHVISQFDPAPVLCYLYADMHKHANSKESRRFFMEFHSLFLDRTANLKVPLPETIASELEKRRLELLPEDLCRQFTQTLQEMLLPDLHRHLEDFRQKRSMGLTLAEDELSRLDAEPGKEVLDRECSCAEHILSKIEDILSASQPTEEEKCQTMQYVILTYMKQLGVKVKEPRGLEHKRARINFLPKIKKSIKPEKEGEEKVKKPRFHNILNPPRRLSRVDSTSVGKAVALNKQRSPKHPSPPADHADCSAATAGRVTGNQLSDGSDTSSQFSPSTTSPTHSTPPTQGSDTSGQDSDSNISPFCIQLKMGEGLQSGDHQEGISSSTCTQFDFSPTNLEQLQEDDQETFMCVTRMEVQCSVSPAEVHSEDDQGGEMECEEDRQNWQSLVSPGVLAGLTPQEIKRQEVINELFYTERAHLRTLKVLDSVFYQRLKGDGILPPEDIKLIFINLEEIIQLHVSVTEQMLVTRKRNETSVIGQIADDLLAWFGGEEEEKIKSAVGTFCSNMPSALELIKSKKKKDQRFSLFMQAAERNRLCRRLQLKDIIPVEMLRFTKYPLLLDNIAKYTEDDEEKEKVKKAAECCKKILYHVNQAVKEAENRRRLMDYQRRLDISSLKQSENPIILELKNLDLTKRTMVHEGPLSWRVNKDKRIELYAILLEDILVLLQKQDERLVLKFHGKNQASAADAKNIFSPVIKLNTVLVRPVATDNKSFFVLSMSENGAQIYKLTAQSVSDQRTWQCLITQCADAMKAKSDKNKPPPAQADTEGNAIDIIKQDMKISGDPGSALSGSVCLSGVCYCTYKGSTSSPDDSVPPSLNPFDGLKSEDEEEEPVMVSIQEVAEEEGDEEVDEAELEAFLDGQLADGLIFLQDQEQNQEPRTICELPSKGEEALRTLAMLKQALFSHMLRNSEDLRASEGPSADPDTQKNHLQVPPEHPEMLEGNGEFLVLDFGGGSKESNTDDDMEVEGDIDMRRLLSSSQLGDEGSGPDLSRQLMTHLRLLQADLQYLKEVELKYHQLCQSQSEAATTEDNNNQDGVQR